MSGTIPFPTAYIAGSTEAPNLALLNLHKSVGPIQVPANTSALIHDTCGDGFNDPLALNLTPTTWNQEFGGAANDGIVLVTSQLNGMPSTLTFSGVIHSPGFERLNFSPPAEVDSASGIPDAVVNLLNESVYGADFFSSN